MLCRKYYIFVLLTWCSLVAGAQNSLRTEGNTVFSRFAVPDQYERVAAVEESFAAFLRHLPLLPSHSSVKRSDGTTQYFSFTAAVIDMEIDGENLQQHAQSLMRLWAEYLYEQQRFSNIHFHIRNNRSIGYEEWSKGMKIIVDRKAYWTKTPNDSKKYRTFRLYFHFIFRHSDFGTLMEDIRAVSFAHLRAGDILLRNEEDAQQAVMILDMAVDRRTGQQIVLLATGGTPAHSIHVIENNETQGAWFPVNKDGKIQVREITFTEGNAYRFTGGGE